MSLQFATQWPAFLSKSRSAVAYAVALIAAAVIAFAYTVLTQTIFGCTAAGYSEDGYLAYCHADKYGDYEHGAILFGLEPGVQESIRRADVLFLGNSRLQFAMSSTAVEDGFAREKIGFYLLGAGYGENMTFGEEVLRRLRPSARMYVINADQYFVDRMTPPTRMVLKDPGGRRRYETKQWWQPVHRTVCAWAPWLCGGHYAQFRSRTTGVWSSFGMSVDNAPVGYEAAEDAIQVEQAARIAPALLNEIEVPRACIVLTIVPTRLTKAATAAAIARRLGVPFLDVRLQGLATADGSHLDAQSVARWSTAFMDALTPLVQRCVTTRAGKMPALHPGKAHHFLLPFSLGEKVVSPLLRRDG